jgi:hypothetical protein
MRTVRSVWLGACLLLVAMGMRGAAAPPPPAGPAVGPPVSAPGCGVPQSPRNVNPTTTPSPYLCTVNGSLVSVSQSQDYVDLRARPGVCPQRLVRCGQHYHAPVENVQGCPGETTLMPLSGKTPGIGQWIEVHTVYAPDARRTGCDPEGLDCCVGHPVLVLGFSAKVVAGTLDRPILTPTTGALAEWSGSNTGRDTNVSDCKPIAAFWSFRLTQPRCVGVPGITQAQLTRHLPGGAQGARDLQAGQRISKDLVRVP